MHDGIRLKITSDYSDMKCILMGDFNFDLLNFSNGGMVQEFVTIM